MVSHQLLREIAKRDGHVLLKKRFAPDFLDEKN